MRDMLKYILTVIFVLLSCPALAQTGQDNVFSELKSEYPDIRVAIKAHNEVTISSQAQGTIQDLPLEDGGRFKQGDTLLKLDCGVLKAQVEKARAQAKRQQLILDSNERLAKLNSKSSLEVKVSRAEAEAAAAEALSMEKMLDKCEIIAPFDGRIGALHVRENQHVVEGAPLMELLDDSGLVLEFIVPSVWISWFRPGYEFSFDVDETGGSYRAVLDHLGGRVDPVSQSIKAYARLVEPDTDLIPGMSGSAQIKEPEAAASSGNE